MSTRACRGATWWRAWCARRWPGTIRAAAVADSGSGAAQAAQVHHRGGRRRRHVPPGLRVGRLTAEANPRGWRQTGHVPPWRQRPRLGAQAALLRRHRATPPLLIGRTRSGCWPALLHRVSQRPPRHSMAPAQAALHRARPLLLRRRSRRPRHGWMAPVQVALHRARPLLLRRRSRHSVGPLTADQAARQPEESPAHRRLASLRALVCQARRLLLRRRTRRSAGPLTEDRAARRPEQRAALRRLAALRGQAYRARQSPLRRRSPPSACSPTVDRPKHQPGPRHTRPAILPTAATNLRLGSTFPRRFGATSGYATVHAAVIAIRSPGAAAPLPICCRSTTCCPSHRAVDRSRPISSCRALLITECATATVRLWRRSPRCSASSAPAGAPLDCAGRQLAGGPAGIPFAAPRAQRASSLPPLQTRAGRCRCAHARRCRGLPSTISCRFRRSHPAGWYVCIHPFLLLRERPCWRRTCNDAWTWESWRPRFGISARSCGSPQS